MTREVDIKALVSHIVRGDGMDKCRICMSDTTDGHVYLGDTVMTDGDRNVTLAELLETITGVEVDEQPGLPVGTCRVCSENIVSAIKFKQLCDTSQKLWEDSTNYISQIYDPTAEDKAYYIFYNSVKTVVRDQTERVSSIKKAVEKLNGQVQRDPTARRQAKRLKTNGQPYPCSCPDCGKKFSVPSYLNSHLRSTSKLACPECCIVMHKTKLAQHLSSTHKKYSIVCNLCHGLSDNLDQHYEECHKGKSHHCKVCGCSYETERSLITHMYCHSLFHCRTCSHSFENRRCFKYHQRQCKITSLPTQTYDQYVCDHCGGIYTKKPSLRIHIIQKHLNVLPYVCVTCGKRTSTIAHLKSHESTHTDARKIYECHCGAKMRTELGFHLHQRIHTGEKPYECKECGEKFLSSSRRLDHIKRRHRSTKDMPHGCDKCPARFVRPFELKKHYLSVHFSQIDVLPAKRGVRRKN